MELISSDGVRNALRERREVALLDVRPEPEHAHGHPLFAASFPLAQLEARARRGLLRPTTPIAILAGDRGGGRDGRRRGAAEAAARLHAEGYVDVAVLDGGLDGWVRSGGEVFTDVNSPSKAFGELVAERAATPMIGADELHAALASGDHGGELVLVDARTFAEHRTMTVPGSVSVPGAELVLRVAPPAPSGEAAAIVVVHCAGRTRSIVGAQSLINAGLDVPVVALRNGTIGWTRAGHALRYGATDRLELPDAATQADAARRARRVADRCGAGRVAPDGLAALAEGGARTVYRFDVRSPEEHEQGAPSGFAPAPGGQLVQETDVFAPVRGARIVLFDDRSVRADMTASWLAQMGWDVFVADGDWPLGPGAGAGGDAGALAALRAQLDGRAVLDLSPSRSYRAAHVAGASWVTAAGVREALRAGHVRPDRIALLSEDGVQAGVVAAQLRRAGWDVPAPAGGTTAWRRAGGEVETGLTRCWSEPDDVYRRPYEGVDAPPEAQQAYIDWELGLVAQLERDGTHGFWVLGAAQR